MAVLNRFVRRKTAVLGAVILLLFLLVALLAPLIAPYDPYELHLANRLELPSRSFVLGNDSLGRDIASRILYGARISLFYGAAIVAVALTAGVVLGVIAGYCGGIVDSVIMRAMDILLAFPGVLLAIAVVSIIGPGLTNACVAIAIARVPQFSRLVRALTLKAMQLDFVESARAIGAPHFRIIVWHVIPTTFSSLIVMSTMDLAFSILVLSTLSFLGLGAVPPTPEWGAMLSRGRSFLLSAPHVTVIPGVAIALVVMGLNLLGDGLRDALDPKMKDIGI